MFKTSSNTMPFPVKRRGAALMTVIVATVLVGALAAGSVFVGVQEQRMGEGVRRASKSTGLANGGAVEVLRSWNPQTNNSIRIYPLDSIQVGATASPNGVGVYAGRVYKLTNEIFLMDVAGRDSVSFLNNVPDNGARDRIGLLARIVPLNVDIQAAMTVGGPVNFGGGNTFVNGTDATPPGWAANNCPPASATIAGVRAKSAGDIGASQGQVSGSPDSVISPGMDSSTFTQYGTSSYTSLANAASITLPAGTYNPAPSVSGGVCQSSNSNWGDGNTPSNPCGTRFPIVHITGNATIGAGQGQGILLVDGNLTMSGAFNFFGIIIVRGATTTTAGANVNVYGGLMMASMNFATTSFNGNVNVKYSKCALTKAKDGTGTPAMLRSRGWTELL
jgi:hypothetical protein